MEDIGLDGLAEGFDIEGNGPFSFAEAECLLEAGGFAWEEGDGDFGHSGGFPCDETVACSGNCADVATARFCIRES